MIRKAKTISVLGLLIGMSSFLGQANHASSEEKLLPQNYSQTLPTQCKNLDCSQAGQDREKEKNAGILFADTNAPRFLEPPNFKERLALISCDAKHIHLAGKLGSGRTYEVKLEGQVFDPKRHRITNEGKTVDGLNFGGPKGWYGMDGPLRPIPAEFAEFSVFSVQADKKPVQIPRSAYATLFNPQFCEIDHMKREAHLRVAAIESRDGRFLYVYLQGSGGAGTYWVKWAFDQKRYITRITALYDNAVGFEDLDAVSHTEEAIIPEAVR